MLVTLQPPNFEGIAIAPVVALGIAVELLDPPPTDASPLLTVYVHVMPLTISVAAKVLTTINPTTIVNMCFISHSPSCTPCLQRPTAPKAQKKRVVRPRHRKLYQIAASATTVPATHAKRGTAAPTIADGDLVETFRSTSAPRTTSHRQGMSSQTASSTMTVPGSLARLKTMTPSS